MTKIPKCYGRLLLIGLSFIGLINPLVAGLKNKTPADTVLSFMKAIANGDSVTAAKYHNSNEAALFKKYFLNGLRKKDVAALQIKKMLFKNLTIKQLVDLPPQRFVIIYYKVLASITLKKKSRMLRLSVPAKIYQTPKVLSVIKGKSGITHVAVRYGITVNSNYLSLREAIMLRKDSRGWGLLFPSKMNRTISRWKRE